MGARGPAVFVYCFLRKSDWPAISQVESGCCLSATIKTLPADCVLFGLSEGAQAEPNRIQIDGNERRRQTRGTALGARMGKQS